MQAPFAAAGFNFSSIRDQASLLVSCQAQRCLPACMISGLRFSDVNGALATLSS